MSHNISKLPQWAQRKIESLERREADWKKKYHELVDEIPDSNVRIRNYSDGNVSLPQGTEVIFYFEDDAHDGSISFKHGTTPRGVPIIEMYASGGSIKLVPSSSNIMFASVEKWNQR